MVRLGNLGDLDAFFTDRTPSAESARAPGEERCPAACRGQAARRASYASMDETQCSQLQKTEPINFIRENLFSIYSSVSFSRVPEPRFKRWSWLGPDAGEKAGLPATEGGSASTVDLAIIGGGINGCGIARDAAGRGLSVLLCEKDDLAERHLVGLDQADPWRPALSRILRVPAGARGADRARGAAARRRRTSSGRCASCCRTKRGLRPAWLIRARPVPLRPSRRAQAAAGARDGSTCARDPAGAPLKPLLHRGFEYSDCWVDDARLVVLNALDAAERGADDPDAHRAASRRAARASAVAVVLESARRASAGTVAARALVNAAGPWVAQLLGATRSAAAAPAACGWSRAATSSCRGCSTRPRLHLPERRQAHRLRHSLRARLHADRHHRRRLSRAIPQTSASTRARSTISAQASANISRKPIAPRRRRLDLFRRAAAATTMASAKRRRRSTRDYVLELDGAGGARRCCRSSAARSRPIAGSPRQRWRSCAACRCRSATAPGPRRAAARRRHSPMPAFESACARPMRRRPWLPARSGAPLCARLRHAGRRACSAMPKGSTISAAIWAMISTRREIAI